MTGGAESPANRRLLDDLRSRGAILAAAAPLTPGGVVAGVANLRCSSMTYAAAGHVRRSRTADTGRRSGGRSKPKMPESQPCIELTPTYRLTHAFATPTGMSPGVSGPKPGKQAGW